MDAITAILTAVVAGATEAFGSTAKQAIQDLYAALKQHLQEKHPQAKGSLEALEKKPDSVPKKESLKEDLQDSGAAQDGELLKKAQTLLSELEKQAQLAQAIGVNLEEVKMANLRLKEISVTGEQATEVSVKKGEFSGDIEISGLKVSAKKP